jgi:hypothetical protein
MQRRELAAFLERPWLGDPAVWQGAYAGDGQLGLRFRGLFAGAARRLGAQATEHAPPPAALAEPYRPHWTLTDWTRAAMLARAFESVPSSDQPRTLLHLFEAGEIGEQVSILRTLSLFPEPERFVETGVHSCRTNALSVFEAIVCENPFPAAHFPALSFNQAVLKAIFMGASVQRIENLGSRITPELKRMVAGYASERRAAGRVVPSDVPYIESYGAEQ